MGVALGDYVQASRHLGRTKRGTRGQVVRLDSDEVRVKTPEGRTFAASTDDLIRLVRGEDL